MTLNPVLPPPRKVLDPVEALLVARSAADLRQHFARWRQATRYAWEPAKGYVGKTKKWIGTGDDAGKKPRYQDSQPGTGRAAGKKDDAPAPSGTKKAPAKKPATKAAPKAEKKKPVDMEELKQVVADVRAGKGDREKAKEVLRNLTGEQLDQLKKLLNIKGGGRTKAEKQETLVGGGKEKAEKKPEKKPEEITPDAVASEIQNEINEYGRVGLSPSEINSGECGPFAENVVKAIRARGGRAELGTPKIGPAHVWVVSGGRHYDAQHPDGVDDPSELTFFQDNPDVLEDGWKATEAMTGKQDAAGRQKPAEKKPEEKPAEKKPAPTQSSEPWGMDFSGLSDYMDKNPEFKKKFENKYGSLTYLSHYGFIKDAVKAGKEVPVELRRKMGLLENWEMSPGEYHQSEANKRGAISKKYINRGDTDVDHKASVEAALSAGKPVPPEVLADYPDLAEKYGQKPPEKPASKPLAAGKQRPKEGDTNAQGLVFKGGRWRRDGEKSAGKKKGVLKGLGGPTAEEAAPDVLGIVEELSKSSNPKIPELWDRLKQKYPDMTREQFDGLLMDMRAKDLVTLQISGHADAEERHGEGVQSEKGMYFYVQPGEKAKTPGAGPQSPPLNVPPEPSQEKEKEKPPPPVPPKPAIPPEPQKRVSQHGAKPTDKQVNFVLSLLSRHGYGTKYMHSKFKDIGASMRERSGSVKDWLNGMSRGEMSELIDRIQKRHGK